MITVHKDILKHLKIEHLFLTGEKNCFCGLVAVSGAEWRVNLDVPYEGNAILNIKYKGLYTEAAVTVKKDADTECFLIHFVNSDDENIKEILSAVIELEKNTELWNKRTEERFSLGVNNSEKFNLESPEQLLIAGNAKYPCMVNDVSFRGMKITTFASSAISSGNEITVILKFVNPIEQISLKGVIQAVTMKTPETKSGRSRQFAIVSIQFLETPLVYKQRLGRYISDYARNKKDNKKDE